MGVAATTTGATMSAIQESLALLSVKLGRIAERQDKMLADLKKTTAALMPNPTTTPMFAPNGVLEQPSVKPLSPPLFSAFQAVGAGVPHPDAILTSTMPTRCSTSGLGVSSGSNQAAVAFPSLNNTKATLLTPVELLGDDASKVMSMVSRVGDNAEDVAAYVLFEKMLQRDDVKCKPWISFMNLPLDLNAGTIRISFMNLPLDLNAVEDSKCRILAVELYFQWDPGTMLNAFIDAISGIEWGILIIRTSSQNYGYEFYSNQQSKLHCAKSEFRMLPSKDLQIPWDPGDWQNNAVCASPAQPFQVLETPWDPGALSMSRRDNLGESWSGVRLILRHEYAIAWGQAMFFGGGIVTPGTLGEVGLNVMGHGLLIMGWQCRWRASKAKLHLEKGIEQKREKASRCSGGLLPPVPFSGGCYPQAVCIPRWQLSTSCSYLYLTSGDAVATGYYRSILKTWTMCIRQHLYLKNSKENDGTITQYNGMFAHWKTRRSRTIVLWWDCVAVSGMCSIQQLVANVNSSDVPHPSNANHIFHGL